MAEDFDTCTMFCLQHGNLKSFRLEAENDGIRECQCPLQSLRGHTEFQARLVIWKMPFSSGFIRFKRFRVAFTILCSGASGSTTILRDSTSTIRKSSASVGASGAAATLSVACDCSEGESVKRCMTGRSFAGGSGKRSTGLPNSFFVQYPRPGRGIWSL